MSDSVFDMYVETVLRESRVIRNISGKLYKANAGGA